MSSGEAVALALKGNKNCRFFGAATGGATTATQPIWLGAKAMLFVTTALYVDHEGTVYGKPIRQDEMVRGGPKLVKNFDFDSDPVISAAKASESQEIGPSRLCLSLFPNSSQPSFAQEGQSRNGSIDEAGNTFRKRLILGW